MGMAWKNIAGGMLDLMFPPLCAACRTRIAAEGDDTPVAWLGRDGGTVADWTDIRREAADAHNDRTAAYLLGIPLLADFIEEGLNTLGVSLEEEEMGRL